MYLFYCWFACVCVWPCPLWMRGQWLWQLFDHYYYKVFVRASLERMLVAIDKASVTCHQWLRLNKLVSVLNYHGHFSSLKSPSHFLREAFGYRFSKKNLTPLYWPAYTRNSNQLLKVQQLLINCAQFQKSPLAWNRRKWVVINNFTMEMESNQTNVFLVRRNKVNIHDVQPSSTVAHNSTVPLVYHPMPRHSWCSPLRYIQNQTLQ